MTDKPKIPTVQELLDGIQTPEGFTRTVEEGKFDHPNIEYLKEKFPEYDRTWPVLKLESEDQGIWIEISFSEAENENAYLLADGHVSYRTSRGIYSFDRRGVEDSFYIDNPAKRNNSRVHFYPRDRVTRPDGVLGSVVSGAGYRGWGDDRQYEDRTVIHWDGAEEPAHYSERQLKRMKIVMASVIDQTNAVIADFITRRIPESREKLERSESVPTIPFSVTPESKARIVGTLQGGGQYSFMPSGFGTGYRLSTRKTRWAEKGKPELARFFDVPAIWYEKFDAD